MNICMAWPWDLGGLWPWLGTQISENPPRPGPIRTVVVIEDNVDAADTLRELLEMWGYQVTVAYTGPAGVAAVRLARPELVLCDLSLPGCSGFEVARQIRADPAVRGARLYALTGYGSPEDQARGQAAGFDRHLVKPVHPETLQQLLALG